jgi:hypothetical protein
MRLSCAVLAVLLASPAPAQEPPRCAPHAQIIGILAAQYGETQQGYGINTGDALVEVYANREAGTFTILATKATGEACIVTDGGGWVFSPQAPAPQGNPT